MEIAIKSNPGNEAAVPIGPVGHDGKKAPGRTAQAQLVGPCTSHCILRRLGRDMVVTGRIVLASPAAKTTLNAGIHSNPGIRKAVLVRTHLNAGLRAYLRAGATGTTIILARINTNRPRHLLHSPT